MIFNPTQLVFARYRALCAALGTMALMVLTIASAGADQNYAGPNLVFDSGSGNVLYSQKAGERWYPASLTKMMTAYVVFKAIKAGKISLKTRLKVSRKASRQPPSKIGLRAGTRISVNKALEAMIVRSGNDVAMVLAEGIGRTEARFVKRMNATAKKLGMNATTFANPHGLNNKRQITTARDIGILAQALIKEFPQYRRYFRMQKVTVGKKTLKTRNKLLKSMAGADGMKTGFLCVSGYNIVVTATRGDRRLVAVVMGSNSAKMRDARAAQLLDRAFSAPSGSNPDAAKLVRLANSASANKPTNMRSVVCKPAKKKRRAKKRSKKHKHKARGS